MKKYIITTDSSSDLSLDFINKNQVMIFDLGIVKDGVASTVKLNDTYKDFYDDIRKGCQMTTTAISLYVVKEEFKKLLIEGYDILHLGFSSSLSSSHATITIASNELIKEFPDRRIEVIDTLSTTVGLSLIVESAVKLKSQGKSLDEVINWVETNKCKYIHQFIVDDLNHLFRGGRISKTSAFIGSSLNIKPILALNNQGAISLIKNERGHKRAMKSLVQHLGDHYRLIGIKEIVIGHTDAYEQAKKLKEMFISEYEIEEITIREINPVIGVHIGSDALVVAYLGQSRVDTMTKSRSKCC